MTTEPSYQNKPLLMNQADGLAAPNPQKRSDNLFDIRFIKLLLVVTTFVLMLAIYTALQVTHLSFQVDNMLKLIPELALKDH